MESWTNLPESIRVHLNSLIESSGMSSSPEIRERISGIWLEKKRLFEEQIKCLEMNEVDTFPLSDLRGILVLTYSGSLISLGTLRDEGRWLEYASIKLRTDVPEIIRTEVIQLSNDLHIDKSAEFSGGPIKQSSAVYKIAVCGPELSVGEQEKRIREATIFLTNGFIRINKTLALTTGETPDHFNMKTMISYVAKRNDIAAKKAKLIVDDFLSVVETGVLLGERVPLGRIGRLSLKVKPPQKARVARNPATGEKLTIPAKPEQAVPRISFGKFFKERSASVDPDTLS